MKEKPRAVRRAGRHGMILVVSWSLMAGISPEGLAGQVSGFDLTYGQWWKAQTATVYSMAYFHPLVGPLSYGIGAVHLSDGRSLVDRTQTGAELSLSVARDGSGLYSAASVGLGVVHRGGALAPNWSAGLGYAWRPFSFVSIGAEARYRFEDQSFKGFWDPGPSNRRGAFLQLRFAVGRGDSRVRSRGPDPVRPPEPDIRRLSFEAGRAPAAASGVVVTALDVMGTPYTWGGNDGNGFDCSGLIQYAYAQHGIVLPRVSYEQATSGRPVALEPASLHPGDILGFAVEGDRVTHVGLYIGDGQFIHSASAGVKLTSLLATDPDSQWWQQRWIVARRVVD